MTRSGRGDRGGSTRRRARGLRECFPGRSPERGGERRGNGSDTEDEIMRVSPPSRRSPADEDRIQRLPRIISLRYSLPGWVAGGVTGGELWGLRGKADHLARSPARRSGL
jgi:hypothetical protein